MLPYIKSRKLYNSPESTFLIPLFAKIGIHEIPWFPKWWRNSYKHQINWCAPEASRRIQIPAWLVSLGTLSSVKWAMKKWNKCLWVLAEVRGFTLTEFIMITADATSSAEFFKIGKLILSEYNSTFLQNWWVCRPIAQSIKIFLQRLSKGNAMSPWDRNGVTELRWILNTI